MTALKSDTRVELSFRGRFNFGIDQWAYVPFDVPAGTRRIDVSTSPPRALSLDGGAVQSGLAAAALDAEDADPHPHAEHRNDECDRRCE
jgi:hypothetical protein